MWRCSLAVNQNGFNSRITSEALEEKFRQVFPAQAGAELIQDLYASGVIQPVVDFSRVAEGSTLPVNLQTAWDFATGYVSVSNTTTTAINNTGFWQVGVNASITESGGARSASIQINDGFANKIIWEINSLVSAGVGQLLTDYGFVVFLRAGDSLTVTSSDANSILDVWFRQIADVNGTLVNPLGFTF